MKIFTLVMFVVFGFLQNQCDKSKITTNANKSSENKNAMNKEQNETKFDKLPDGVTSDAKVRKDIVNEKGEVISYETITVANKLKQLGAKYENDKLVDSNGREIKFYTPPVRGVSQGFEEDAKQQERDKKELDELKSKYTVIILYVDPRSVM